MKISKIYPFAFVAIIFLSSCHDSVTRDSRGSTATTTTEESYDTRFAYRLTIPCTAQPITTTLDWRWDSKEHEYLNEEVIKMVSKSLFAEQKEALCTVLGKMQKNDLAPGASYSLIGSITSWENNVMTPLSTSVPIEYYAIAGMAEGPLRELFGDSATLPKIIPYFGETIGVPQGFFPCYITDTTNWRIATEIVLEAPSNPDVQLSFTYSAGGPPPLGEADRGLVLELGSTQVLSEKSYYIQRNVCISQVLIPKVHVGVESILCETVHYQLGDIFMNGLVEYVNKKETQRPETLHDIKKHTDFATNLEEIVAHYIALAMIHELRRQGTYPVTEVSSWHANYYKHERYRGLPELIVALPPTMENAKRVLGEYKKGFFALENFLENYIER